MKFSKVEDISPLLSEMRGSVKEKTITIDTAIGNIVIKNGKTVDNVIDFLIKEISEGMIDKFDK